MYLKALEMQGFKSFPDKISLEFGKGITGVVGPNGSGKSNIADAVRWVLGEQSTKSLRGAKMEDVIFSGTKERRAVGFAEVTLTLDNADGALNNPEKEVRVARRYYRSGESAYLINGKSVRLRDINELFMDTGLGRDGYSLVGQGKIEEMVSAKSDQRRDMLEEAAGISHYRYRRVDALRRLDQTEENLVRLRDIVGELQARVGPLEKQSLKAQQFLVYAGEKRELEIGLWLHTLSRSAEQIREQAGRMSVAQSQYDAAGLTLERLAAEIEDAAAAIREINIRTETLRAQIGAAEERAAAQEAAAAVHETSLRHNAETEERLTAEIEAGKTADDSLGNERRELDSQIAVLRVRQTQLAADAQSLGDRLTQLRSRDEAFSDEYNTENAELARLVMEISGLQIAAAASGTAAEEIRQRLAALEQSLRVREGERAVLTAREEKQASEFTAANDRLTEMTNAAAGYGLRIRKAEARAAEAKRAHEDKLLDLRNAQQRLRFLEDTEKNMEGYGGSVKAVLREYARGTLTGIRGTLIGLIRVDEDYQTAIETALGGAAQDIVTETDEDAKRAIRMLKNSNAGRATFLPMSAIRGRVLRENGLEDAFGFVNIASELVETAPEYREIVESLLGRIAVVEDLDCATAIAKRFGYRFKIVTLDGQIINAGGSMTGGSKISHAGFLARRTEMEKLRAELKNGETVLAGLAQANKTAAEALAKERADRDGAQGEILRLTRERGEKEAALTLTRSALEENVRAATELERERGEAHGRLTALESRGEDESAGIRSLEEQRAAQEEKLRALTGGRDDLQARREALNAEISENNLQAVGVLKELQAKEESIRGLEARRAEGQSRMDLLRAQLEEVRGQVKSLQENASAARSAAAEQRALISELNGQIEALILKREAAEKTGVTAREQERQKNEEREKLGGELVRLEERKNALMKEQEDIERRLFEEYALTRREAALAVPEIESVTKAQKRLTELRGLIKGLGSVNVAAIEEYKEVSARYEFLSGQVDDVERSKKELLRLIDELTDQMRERFRDRFDAINAHFQETFAQLFGGGAAELVLENEGDILECGIDIKAQPPGKNVKSLSLLSGGEKGLIGIALLFSILKVRPAPFCVFDEVEAALDDVNVVRYAQYVRMMTEHTQFILITHRRGTMEEADTLYGVTMQENGVSKLLELRTAQLAAELRLEE